MLANWGEDFFIDKSPPYRIIKVVTGYRIYRKTTTILGIEFHDYVYLLRVNDNHVETAVFFDLTAYNRTSTYITVEVND